MMKKLLSFLFIILSISIFAQMDTEHWFAPMYNSIASNSTVESYLYVSTNETTPFKVEVYNNNTILTALTIAKGQPGIFQVPIEYLSTDQKTDVLKPISKGLQVIGDKKFFANVRLQMDAHAEIITSKGKAALGKKFYSVNSPLPREETYFNFSTGIIATENNTNIIINNFNPNVVFFDNKSYTQLNVTLNKGQCYLIAGTGNNSNNLDGFIGAKIESDKPIVVVNGNFGASVSTASNSSKDIYMDESVPIERLGDSFAVMKGNAPIGKEMEQPMVVATKNNTQIFLNDETTPYSFPKNGVTKNFLNEGEYTLIDESKYIDKGNGVFNMFIRTTENAYVYQNLAGVSSGSIYATGGFNYIPPLNCFLPNKIDEIPEINKIGNTPYDTKLNIITQKGAIVSLNGTTLGGANGPYSITGNTEWEMYSVENVSSNITINSTKSLTAGIAAGNLNVGYGGYFAGFNSIPLISKGGDCDKGIVTLEVDDSYDLYQWYLNGIPISGATSYSIVPTESGYYTCEITKYGCKTVTTTSFKFQRCPFKSSQNFMIADCKTVLSIPAPEFTTSTQSEDYSTLITTVQPTNGTISIDNTTGIITYTLTNPTANTDTFTVKLLSNDPLFPDTEYFTYTIDIKHLNAFNGEVFACFNIVKKNAIFNLKNAVLSNDANITNINYYDAGVLITSDVTQYESVAKTIQAELTNSYGCTKTVNIDLKYFPITNVNTSVYNSTLCDLDFDGLYEVKLSTEVSPKIVVDYTKFNINYFLHDPIVNPYEPVIPDDLSFSTSSQKVYVLVTSKDGCSDFKLGEITFTAGTKLTVNDTTTPLCDNDRNGVTEIHLSDYVPSNYLYYNSLAKAQEGDIKKVEDNTQQITKDTTFYIRTVDATFCPNIFKLKFEFNQPNISSILKDKTICKNTTTQVNTETTFNNYIWYNANSPTTPIAQGSAVSPSISVGEYFVDLFSNGCVYRQNFKIIAAIDPIIDSIIEEGNTITVNVSGGNPPYEYSLDQINWQTSNVFTNLNRGVQTVYVRDKNNCTPVEKEFLIINLINVITPNGDGINDVLDYSDLSIKKDVKIFITDRYGRKVYSNDKQTNYIWDGKDNNRQISTGTYWYILEWTEPDTGLKVNYNGWILVKNRN